MNQEIILSNNQIIESDQIITQKKDIRSYMTREEINEILNTIQNNKHRIIMTVLWQTGLRVSEIINVVKRNIDFKNHRMSVLWQKNRRWKERIIPLHNNLVPLLQLYTTNMKFKERVFPYTRQYVYSICKKHLGNSPHVLRHSFAVNFLEQTKSSKGLVILKQLLGHSHINTTMEYLRIVPNDLKDELDKIEFN
jgi:integrase/recombinase XerD